MQEINQRSRFDLARDERRQIEVEEGLENLSYYLDGLFKIPGIGWRFGLDSLIGLVPNVGDTLTSFASFYILFAGVRYGVPKITLLRMAMNIAIDYIVGMIPFVGDAFDFVWKSNAQNMNLIRTRATGLGNGTKSDYIFVFGMIAFLILLLIGSIITSAYIIYYIFTSMPLI